MIGEKGAFSLRQVKAIWQVFKGESPFEAKPFIILDTKRYLIQDEKELKYYLVIRLGRVYTCSCPFAVFRKIEDEGKECSHERRARLMFQPGAFDEKVKTYTLNEVLR